MGMGFWDSMLSAIAVTGIVRIAFTADRRDALRIAGETINPPNRPANDLAL